MAKTIGFQIVVQGTQEQQKKIADLRGELDRLTRQRKVDAKAVKDKDGLDSIEQQELLTQMQRHLTMQRGHTLSSRIGIINC